MLAAMKHDAGPGVGAALPAWEAKAPVAALVTGDSDALHWGRRWLESYGFDVQTATNLAQAERTLASGSVEILVVDGSFRHEQDGVLGAALRMGGEAVPMLTLCSSDKQARAALDQGSTDVAWTPREWPLIGQRAARLVQAHRTARKLASTRAELSSLKLDQAARQSSALGSIDALTGLPQRKSYERALESTLAAGARTGSATAVMLLDVDRFKLVNETFGRQRASEVLRQLAERLNGCLRSGETTGRRRAGFATAGVARFDGDSFSMMLSPVGDQADVSRIGQALVDSLARAVVVDGIEVYVSASLGIAVAPADGRTPEELLHRADLALAEARRRGGGMCRLYSPELASHRDRALQIDRLLRRTLERDELELHYQPIIDARSRRVVAAEALLRWHHPELGDVSPLQFIPVAEETGFMVEIGRWVLKTACRQLRDWIDAGLPAIRMAVNISLCQLMRGNLPEVVDEALGEARIEPALLEIELSERGALCSDPEILRQLHALRARGVRLSVDDFGTGESAIAYLKRFPLDTLKVDQSFIAGALANPDDAVITSAMISMAHSLRLRVVAEGVEKIEQVRLLEDLHCEELQGFFFSKGVPGEAFQELLGRELGAPASGAAAADEASGEISNRGGV